MRLFSGSVKGGLTVAVLLVAVASSGQRDAGAGQFQRSMHQSMTRMDRDMASAPMTGDADQDFAAMMLPHHQGAIEMAKVELLYGRDPVMRRLAQEILVDQQSEIDAMQLWFAKRRAAKTKREQ